jgi:hypothetical protein
MRYRFVTCVFMHTQKTCAWRVPGEHWQSLCPCVTNRNMLAPVKVSHLDVGDRDVSGSINSTEYT